MFLTSFFSIIFLFYCFLAYLQSMGLFSNNINHDLPSVSVHNAKAREGRVFVEKESKIRTYILLFNMFLTFGFIRKENLTVNLKMSF